MTDDEKLDGLYDEVSYLRRENQRLVRRLEIVVTELNQWKKYVNHIVDLKTEELLTRPLTPIIIIRKDGPETAT